MDQTTAQSVHYATGRVDVVLLDEVLLLLALTDIRLHLLQLNLLFGLEKLELGVILGVGRIKLLDCVWVHLVRLLLASTRFQLILHSNT